MVSKKFFLGLILSAVIFWGTGNTMEGRPHISLEMVRDVCVAIDWSRDTIRAFSGGGDAAEIDLSWVPLDIQREVDVQALYAKIIKDAVMRDGIFKDLRTIKEMVQRDMSPRWMEKSIGALLIALYQYDDITADRD